MISETLDLEGYATFALGKWHLAPTEECTGAGPYNNWPLGKGFQKFYGLCSTGPRFRSMPERMSRISANSAVWARRRRAAKTT